MTRGSASRAVRNLASAAVALETAERVAERRERLVPELAASIERNAGTGGRRRSRSVPMGVVVSGLAAAAALLLIALASSWLWDDDTLGVVVPRGADVAADAGSAVAQIESVSGAVQVVLGGREQLDAKSPPRVNAVHADRNSSAVVRMASGTRILVGSSTSLEVSALPPADPLLREEVTLSVGRVDVAVPRLNSGDSFEVVTQQARIVVHGTRFSVEVGFREAAQWTKVAVTEGQVSVHHATGVAVLGGDSTWTSVADDEPAPEVIDERSDARQIPGSSQQPLPRRRGESDRAKSTGRVASPPRPRSSLGAENALFQSAMRAARRGDDALALALVDEFLAKYPRSPLAPNALLERRRALVRLKRPRSLPQELPSPLAPNKGWR